MMESIIGSTLSPFQAASFLSFLLDVSLKSLPIFAAAGLVCLRLRRASAASRHALWVVTVVSLMCLPTFCILLPRWSVPLLPAAAQHPTQAPTPVGSRVEEAAPRQPLAMEQPPMAGVGKLSRQPLPATGSADSISSPTSSLSAPDVSPSPTAPVIAPIAANLKPFSPTSRRGVFRPTMKQLILAIWLGGVLMVLTRAFIGITAARRLVRRCQEVVSGPLVDAAEQARETLSLSFRVPLRESPPGTVVVPMTFGLLRPVVLLPSGAADWPAERLRVVLLHEIAHVKRRDWLTTMLAEVACALYWFHPLVWLTAHRLRAESEQACDDLVLTSGVQAVDYADHLLEVVRGLTGRRGSMAAVVTMAQERGLTGRLKTILAESKNRSAATGRGLAVAVLTTLVIVMPLAAMHLVTRLNLEKSNGRNATRVATLPGGAQVELVAVTATRMVRNQGKTDTIAPYNSFAPDGTELPISSNLSTSDGNSKARRLHPDWRWTGGTMVSFSRNSDSQLRFYCGYNNTMIDFPCNSNGQVGFISQVGFYSFVLRMPAKTPYDPVLKQIVLGSDRHGHIQKVVSAMDPWPICTGIIPQRDGRADIEIKFPEGNLHTVLTAPLIGTACRHLPTGQTILLSVNSHSLFPSYQIQIRGKHYPTTEVSVTAPSGYLSGANGEVIPLGVGGKRTPLQRYCYTSYGPEGFLVRRVLVEGKKRVSFSFSTAEIKAKHIIGFQYQQRPIHTVVFRNVALAPNSPAARQPVPPPW